MIGTSVRFRNSGVVNQLSADEKKWFALYTKYKCEKYVAEHLSKKNIESYVPIISKTKRYSSKVKHYKVPLINCYVFVKIDKSQYIPALETEFAMKFLHQGKDLLAIPSSEIDLLKRVVGDIKEVYDINESGFQVGEDVEVVSGHLSGLSGKIVSKSGKKSFIMELKSIGFQLLLNIDVKLLKHVVGKITNS